MFEMPIRDVKETNDEAFQLKVTTCTNNYNLNLNASVKVVAMKHVLGNLSTKVISPLFSFLQKIVLNYFATSQ